MSWRVLFQMATVGVFTALVKVAIRAEPSYRTVRFSGRDPMGWECVPDGVSAARSSSIEPDTPVPGSNSSALIPTYIELREAEGPDASKRLYETVLAAAAGLLLVVAIVLAALAPWVLRLLASSFGAPKLELTRALFLLMSPIIPLSALGMIWRSILNTFFC